MMFTLGIIVSMVSIPFFAIAVELESTNFDLVGFLGAIHLVCEHSRNRVFVDFFGAIYLVCEQSSNRVFLTSATP